MEVLKEGQLTGVLVTLLDGDALIVSGLKFEMPPWVKLDPRENQAFISTDGEKWQRSDASELWTLRALDPRQFQQHADREFRRTGISLRKGRISLEELMPTGKTGYAYYAPFVETPVGSDYEIKETERGVSVEFDFPFSKERITLRAYPRSLAPED